MNAAWLGVILMVMGLTAVSAYLLLIVICAMIPSISFIFADTSPYRSIRSAAVTGFNSVGAAWTGVNFYRGGMSFQSFQDALTTPHTWAAVLLSTLAGWLSLYYGPQLAATLIQIRRREQMRRLEVARRKLLEEWGGALAELNRKDD